MSVLNVLVMSPRAECAHSITSLFLFSHARTRVFAAVAHILVAYSRDSLARVPMRVPTCHSRDANRTVIARILCFVDRGFYAPFVPFHIHAAGRTNCWCCHAYPSPRGRSRGGESINQLPPSREYPPAIGQPPRRPTGLGTLSRSTLGGLSRAVGIAPAHPPLWKTLAAARSSALTIVIFGLPSVAGELRGEQAREKVDTVWRRSD